MIPQWSHPGTRRWVCALRRWVSGEINHKSKRFRICIQTELSRMFVRKVTAGVLQARYSRRSEINRWSFGRGCFLSDWKIAWLTRKMFPQQSSTPKKGQRTARRYLTFSVTISFPLFSSVRALIFLRYSYGATGALMADDSPGGWRIYPLTRTIPGRFSSASSGGCGIVPE